MKLFYQSSDGSVVDFMSEYISAQEPETLAGSSWKYTTIAGVNDINKISRFYKETQENKLKLQILADDADSFSAIMDKMHRIFDRDVRRLTPGKLWWGDWYKECFVVETDHSDYDELLDYVETQVTFVSTYSYWIKSTTFSFIATTQVSGQLDYDASLDYDDFDYDRPGTAETVENKSVNECNFRITFFGPCSTPSITIAGHVYMISCTLAAREWAIIDSKSKKVMMYSANGTETNIFHLRGRDDYVFQKIPEGMLPITRLPELGVDITLYDERGEPEWI